MNAQELQEKLKPLSNYLLEELPYGSERQSIVQKGLLLYRQNLVGNIKYHDDSITADVQDVTPVKVTLELEFPRLSKCSCPSDEWCRHRMAAFFAVFSKAAPVTNWIHKWRTTRPEQAAITSPEKKVDLQDILKKHEGSIKKASDLLKDRKQRGNSPEELWDYLQYQYREWDKEAFHRQSHLLDLHIQNFFRKLMKDAPYEREWKPLYKLYVSFFLFQNFDRMMVFFRGKTAETSHYEFLVDEMFDSVKQLSVHAMPFRFDPFIEFLKTKTEELTSSNENSTLAKAEIYRFLWYFLFKKKAWRQAEVQRLQEERAPEDLFYALALLHQYILLEEHELAATEIEKLGTEIVPYSDFWLEQLFQNKKYEQGVAFLKSIMPKVPSYVNSLPPYDSAAFSRWFLRTLPIDWMTENEHGLLRKLLVALLPYSYSWYNEFLLSSKSFRDWVELQRFVGYELREMDNMGLRDAAKEAPQLVLPLYHEGIEFYLAGRNRDNYKQAVKYLKRLRTLYKKLKKTDQWDIYLNFMLEKTKRLRAFHEECRKGKLIDA
ncbi:SWIM zinc finger family protein [Rossellomorea vietnamensis]|uniref:SWIM zinc finger family protein n=1 Tax=Rossellomorea vietnamensis TaxID=218284 RepID=A0A5D4NX01_9BACI|nr:SWIM zinc finger family protein [Rossellomorea vietnamensis]TYS17856.1 SWIM zinc finger family protein [Rossellomorea vietnamensis]